MADPERSFSFVDRIHGVDARSARGRFTVPAHWRRFPGALVAEAIGQLAAHGAMHACRFRRRPVAGLCASIELLAEARPGDTLELTVELESLDDEALTYGGLARRGEQELVRLEGALGPMLPLAEFEDPEQAALRFEALHRDAVPAPRIEIAPLRLERLPDDRGARLPDGCRARVVVPSDAPYFRDHFPRRAVLPGTLLLMAKVELARTLIEAQGAWAQGSWIGTPVLRRAGGVKLRHFSEPGDTLELEAQVARHEENRLTVAVTGRTLEGPRASRSRRAQSQVRLEFEPARRAASSPAP